VHAQCQESAFRAHHAQNRRSVHAIPPCLPNGNLLPSPNSRLPTTPPSARKMFTPQ
jgi:hypothetical protein